MKYKEFTVWKDCRWYRVKDMIGFTDMFENILFCIYNTWHCTLKNHIHIKTSNQEVAYKFKNQFNLNTDKFLKKSIKTK